uniref:NADH dehydrogenase [ubiquinone] 1 alpha subcomplex subunit 8 n=1 Tax=Phallusia mammillata TaxID=59560 RepID=A0A6F9DM32_9ASCI|nr:NADH dehydrogenase [ubiquinone] 1 alpha subcomplex subunit 8 [Phallusia mammillata]
MPSLLNPDGFVPNNTNKFENTKGVKENVDEELQTVFQQIKRGDLGVPSHALKAAAFQYAVQCGNINQEYMLCKKEELDPRKCLKYSHNVSDCAAKFYKTVTDHCEESFISLAQCLESDICRSFSHCREQQLKLDRCLFDKLGFDKEVFSMKRQKIYTDRPKPTNPLHLKNYDYPKPIAPDWSRPFPPQKSD